MICRVWILGGLFALLPTVSNAALMVMIDGIAGPNRQAPYGGWFVAEAVSWGYERGNTAKPFALTVSMEQSGVGFANIAQAAFSGAILKKIVIDMVEFIGQDGQLMVTSRLSCEEALLRSSNTAADSGDRPKVEFELSCAKFSWENFDADKNGAVFGAGKGSWNFKTNTP